MVWPTIVPGTCVIKKPSALNPGQTASQLQTEKYPFHWIVYYAMRYTHHRGLARVSAWVRLKYAAMNLKKIAIWKWNASDFASYIMIFAPFNDKTPVLVF